MTVSTRTGGSLVSEVRGSSGVAEILLKKLKAPPEWMEHASCFSQEAWETELDPLCDTDSDAFIKRFCNKCPVVQECADYADETHPAGGVWAGIYHQ